MQQCGTWHQFLLADGINAKVVSERLGHSSIVMTLDTYAHVLPTMQEDAAKKLETMLYATSG
jgi:integrase